MWSGPRTISTALMRSWDARADTFVTDEPLYAHYLLTTGTRHPGRDDVIAHYETDWRIVVERLISEKRGDKRIHYQKHMAHHLLPDMYGSWLEKLSHAFLIRDPAELIRSLSRVMARPTPEDTGLPQQWKLFRYVSDELGRAAPVVDARDVLELPAAVLAELCRALDVPFSEAMLSWEPGLRPTDGIWARHWYGRVAESTGFMPPSPSPGPVPARLRDLHDACLPLYQRLYRARLVP